MSIPGLSIHDKDTPPPLPLTLEQNEARQKEIMKVFDSIFTSMTGEGDVSVPGYELTVSRKAERIFRATDNSFEVFMGFAERIAELFSIKVGQDFIGIKDQDGTLKDSELFTQSLNRVLSHLKKAQTILAENRKKDVDDKATRVLGILDFPS